MENIEKHIKQFAWAMSHVLKLILISMALDLIFNLMFGSVYNTYLLPLIILAVVVFIIINGIYSVSNRPLPDIQLFSLIKNEKTISIFKVIIYLLIAIGIFYFPVSLSLSETINPWLIRLILSGMIIFEYSHKKQIPA
jgi:hypothetical protein